MKSIFGCCADEVFLYPNPGNRTAIEEVLARDGMAIAQHFVTRANRFIWRVDVVAGAVIVCNQRYAYNSLDELPLCNGTQGGNIEFLPPCNLPAAVRSVALQAVACLGLDVAGVDIVEDDQGDLYVIEVNPEPDIALDRVEFPHAIADYMVSL